jgi:beta-phosphoglucomutase-like phosphatase (HAD superfamily)
VKLGLAELLLLAEFRARPRATSPAAALGVAPPRTVVFEDAPAGVAAAKAAGAYCVAVTTTQPAAALCAADLVVPDLSGLRWVDGHLEARLSG